jgi:cell division protein FtsQ
VFSLYNNLVQKLNFFMASACDQRAADKGPGLQKDFLPCFVFAILQDDVITAQRGLPLKKLLLKLFIAFVFLPSAIAGTMYWLNQHGFFAVQEVQIELIDAQAQAGFYAPLVEKLEKQMAAFKGESLWSVKMSGVVQILNSQNWIQTHSIVRSWPRTIRLTVKPYDVKLLYLGKGGKYVPIIENGSFLDSVDSKLAPDVALLEGEVFAQKKDLRTKAVQVLKEIPAEGSFSKKTISEMRYSSKEGFMVTLVKSGIQVKIGEEQVALKSARVAQVVDYLETRQFEARVIDANLSKKVLVRLRKDP